MQRLVRAIARGAHERAHRREPLAKRRAIAQRMMQRVAQEPAPHAARARIEQRKERGRGLAADRFCQLEVAARCRIHAHKRTLLFDRERHKLDRNLAGIKQMGRLPGALFVVDAKKERIAVAEANKLGIPVVAIVDTNADPDVITVPIPGNDDAIRSVSLITGALCDVIREARQHAPVRESGEDVEAETYSSDAGGDGGDDAERRRRRPRRKRRPKPEAIAARLKSDGSEAADAAPAEAEA